MGLLDTGLDAASNSLGELIAPITDLFKTPPTYVGPDFKEGLVIDELNDSGVTILTLRLSLTNMPFAPLTYGGSQHVVSEYYPGNAEPATQVFGSREDNITFKGKFKAKHLPAKNPTDLRTIPVVFRDALDGVRKRGNMLKLSLGEWVRYGYMTKVSFNLRTLADIDYTFDFMVISDKKPENAKFAKAVFPDVNSNNLLLMKATAEFEQLSKKQPASFSPTLGSIINSAISDVASAVSAVTKFVDNVIKTGEDAERLANRALGLIRNAASSISQFKRRIGALQAYLGSTPVNSALNTWNEATKAKSARYVMEAYHSPSKSGTTLSAAQQAALATSMDKYSRSDTAKAAALARQSGKSMEEILLEMKKYFEKLAKLAPLKRYMVKQGDTLQTISVLFYKTPNNWELIYKHNQLTSTVLVRGKVLEIPKI